jgi:hypothetical protein
MVVKPRSGVAAWWANWVVKLIDVYPDSVAGNPSMGDWGVITIVLAVGNTPTLPQSGIVFLSPWSISRNRSS